MNKDIMRKLGFNLEVDLVEQGRCPICKEKINKDEFKDDKSRKEFGISGLCQSCQDNTF